VIQKTLEQAGRQAKPARTCCGCRTGCVAAGCLVLRRAVQISPTSWKETGGQGQDWDTRDAMLSLPGVRLDGWPVAHARLVVLRVDAISAPLRRIIMPFNWRVATRRRRHGRLVVRFAIVSLAVVVSSWFRKNANRKTRV
jgi:hypothetical protein